MDNNTEKQPEEEKPLTHEEFSRRGGQRTLERRGKEFLGEIAQKGGETTKAKFGNEHYRRIQLLAAESRRRNREEREKLGTKEEAIPKEKTEEVKKDDHSWFGFLKPKN